MVKRPAFLLAAAVASAAIVAGCGGGDSTEGNGGGFSVRADTTLSTSSLDKALFIDRVNELCRRRWPVILQNFAEYSSWQSPRLSEQELFAKSVRLSYLAGLDFHIFDRIHRMGAPPGERREVEEVIGTMQIAVERGQRQVRVASRAQLVALFADYNRIARRYGLEECLVAGSHLPKGRA